MNLEKYIGSVPEGDYTVRVIDVTAAKAKDDSPKLIFKGAFREIETESTWTRSLKPSALSMLRDDLEAAEALREGESYSDDPAELAHQIYEDLSDRIVRVTVKAGKNGFSDFRISGIALAA